MAAALNSYTDRIKEAAPEADQHPPTADQLSSLAPLLRVRKVEIQDLCRFASTWKSAHEAQSAGWAQFHIVMKGSCRLDLQDGESLQLRAGSVLLIPRGEVHALRSSRGRAAKAPVRVESGRAVRIKTNTRGAGDTELICGRLRFDDQTTSRVIVSVLPAAVVLNVRSAGSLESMRTLVQMIDEELRVARPGAVAVATDLASALFVLMLRAHLERQTSPSALIGLMRSPVCAHCVNAMIRHPAKDWSLDELARLSHVSRATLVRAFQQAAGMAPRAFLTQLRLDLARQRLASSRESLSRIAAAVGYSSESALVRAFTRRFGISPGKTRAEH